MEQDPLPLEWTSELVTRFWAYQSRFPESYFSFKSGAAVASHLRKFVPATAEVLDYGCGPGHLVPHLLAAGFRVMGADVDKKTIGSTTDFTGHQCFLGFEAIDRLVAEKRQFDAIVLLEVIEHLDDFWLVATLNNVHALLRPGGLLFVTTPNEELLQDNVVYCPISNVTFHRWQHVRSWSRSTLAEALSRHGFVQVSTQIMTFAEQRPDRVSGIRWFAAGLLGALKKPKSLVAIARAPLIPK